VRMGCDPGLHRRPPHRFWIGKCVRVRYPSYCL